MGVRQTLQDQMSQLVANPENGTYFYQGMFTKVPDLRNFFAGASNLDPAKIHESERFQRQGMRLISSIHAMVAVSDTAEGMAAEALKHWNLHLRFKIPYPIYEAFEGLWVSFVEGRIGMNEDQRDAWHKLFTAFCAEMKKQYEKNGKPTS